MTLAPSAMREHSRADEWTTCRATLFVAAGSAVLWSAIVYGLMRLF
jgi:hypothetical protein